MPVQCHVGREKTLGSIYQDAQDHLHVDMLCGNSQYFINLIAPPPSVPWLNSPLWARAFSGQVISLMKRPLPDNTKHSQDRHPCPWWVLNPPIPAGEWPQVHALDHVATGICV